MASLSRNHLSKAAGSSSGNNYRLPESLTKCNRLYIAGGTQHVFNDRGEGFCLLNDQAIDATYLLNQKLAAKIGIIDLYVRQRNGTGEIFQGHLNVFTFFVHGQTNYSLKKEISDLDIGLSNGTFDDEYLKIISTFIPKLINLEKPDFIFYLSGVDILHSD